ncbi:1,4-alpha-glucan branching protein GlgB [Eubacterium multiforme]|uniref:1,4-alpha-glucan branching enzyme GlgB n=1 Tax=Eubacterium multiforme TaxID=83339 RepID=A0ABT9UYA9_9FIRM|nr:1,4-alpha-glucan branching protein GlgB [Eubacterium multiforme]MDQ0151303.1 1,4-alpha-glucan branching enzyme [Eubacterium multiforme]
MIKEVFNIKNLKIKFKNKEGIKTNKIDSVSYSLSLFHEGRNFQAYNILGSKFIRENGILGVRFTVWAPRAKNIYLVGDFNGFSIDENYKMSKITSNGVWSIFIKDIKSGTKYKYGIEDIYGNINYKADPYAVFSEVRPKSASIVYKEDNFNWSDDYWIDKRKNMNIYEIPINVYEIHLGSWRKQGEKFLTYKELKNILPDYLEDMGYNYVEFMPLAEYPLDESLGYQGVGFYSLTSRYGNLEEFKELVNELHRRNIGVILDWVPGHFCKDGHGLYRFDGTPTYEYEEGWKAENKLWGTSNFDLGKPEVKSFLISNALYWILEYHIDGLKINDVSNILYLNYGREDGEWLPNIYGGENNLEGIDFIKELNRAVFMEFPEVIIIAEESKNWNKVCGDENQGGLGFNFKWNMDWKDSILEYIKLNPIYRKYNHNKLTFPITYNYSENFILPISHDEVSYGKKSLVNKMWGDNWNKFSQVRLFYSYMMGYPGKKLMFMGSEFGQLSDWRVNKEIEWELIYKYPINEKLQLFFKELNNLYKDNKGLWELDFDPEGFKWIDIDNNNQSIISFLRRGRSKNDTLIFVSNFTPIVYYDYRIGVPYEGIYEEVLNTDNRKYGGSGQVMKELLISTRENYKEFENSIKIKVPPMGTVILKMRNKEEI